MLSRNIVLSVAGVALDPDGDSPTVLLRNPSGDRYITVPVGAFEASAIIIEIEGIKPPRPLTHDLFAELFSRHGCRFTAFEIYSQSDEEFLGRIRYRKGLRGYTMEVRPSDGIALALRLNAPIEADAALFASIAGPSPEAASTGAAVGSVLFLDPKTC
jgi:bifunctional DNase/RNase